MRKPRLGEVNLPEGIQFEGRRSERTWKLGRRRPLPGTLKPLRGRWGLQAWTLSLGAGQRELRRSNSQLSPGCPPSCSFSSRLPGPSMRSRVGLGGPWGLFPPPRQALEAFGLRMDRGERETVPGIAPPMRSRLCGRILGTAAPLRRSQVLLQGVLQGSERAANVPIVTHDHPSHTLQEA